MIAQHKAEFEKFQKLKYEDSRFHELGKPLLRIIEDAERRLCGKMESGVHGTYSKNLADKFRAEIKRSYPLIDLVGVEIS